MATTIPLRMGHACGITSTFPIWRMRISQRSITSESGGESRTLNCGYGRGYSVKEVVDTVKSVAGVDFEVHHAPRRAGDPASIVASSDRLKRLGWQPKLDDLPTIVRHAYDWERKLQ